MINWEAVAAGAAVGALVFAAMQAVASGLRSTILYKASTLKCDSEDRRILYAMKLEVSNVSLRHINDMTLRVDMTKAPIGIGIANTTSIDKKTISNRFDDGQLFINISDFPRFEKIEIDMFAACFLNAHRPVSGGNKDFVLKKRSDLISNWAFIAFNSVVIASFVAMWLYT